MVKNLCQLAPGDGGIIQMIGTGQVTKERLESLGLIQGVKVKVIRSAPLGSPRVYQVLNTLVALRNDIARKITVEVQSDEQK